MNQAQKAIIAIISKASQGVDYSPRHGAICPGCGKKTKVYNVRDWDGNVRVRYHRCQNEKCTLSKLKTSIKSIEVEN